MNESDPEPLLEAAKYYLSRRNVEKCRNYVLRAQQSAPQNSIANQILAIADTLAASGIGISETTPDWYAILQIDRYSEDTQLIKHQFKKLILLLNPKDNILPFAEEAFKLIYSAWSVLSNPLKKSQFDDELNIFELKEAADNSYENYSFWTFCPYCYFVYEYARVYEDCCLRCQNEKCRRCFHSVALRTPPPLDVVENGQYCCMGFFPLGFDRGEREEVPLFTPFSPFVMTNENVKNRNDVNESDNERDRDSLVEISDDSNDSSDGFVRKNEGTCVNDKGKGVESKGGQHNEYVWKPVMKKRKKSVPINSKKLMGKGTRLAQNETPAQSVEGLDLNAYAGEDDAYNGNVNVSGVVGGLDMGSGSDFVSSGMEIFTGDDDIFVGLPDCF